MQTKKQNQMQTLSNANVSISPKTFKALKVTGHS